MNVVKFGGSSLATAEQIRKVCDIIRSDPDRRLIVVSAPGRRDKGDAKVTDLLIRCAEKYLADGKADAELQAVIDRYADIAKGLKLPDDVIENIAAHLRERVQYDTSNAEHYTDAMKAAGEDNCARLLARYLSHLGEEAHYIDPKEAGMLLTSEFGNAQVLPESYQRLAALKDAPGISIFPGFFGYSFDGEIVTFPRGGSDITGAILAAAVKADVYENFTDVDSVFSARPDIVSSPQPVHELTYGEMRELSYAGFSVFHEEALSPVYLAGIPVSIKNTDNPNGPGTTIVPKRSGPAPGPVVGIASDGGFAMVYVDKYLMNRELGFGRRLLQVFEEAGLSYEHTPSGIDSISVVLRESAFTPEKEQEVLQQIREVLKPDDVSVERDLALIMIVGEGMRNSVGLAARMTKAFAEAQVNIQMINQGSSELSVMFGVKGRDVNDAVRALYNEFFK
ncbi:MAG: aspartate kinase [Planctomycetes bacterium]|nr:aspartate kinase [Planctomycetota bacterium]